MKYLLTVDFGSTYTKLTAIDVENRKIVATQRAFTTVATHLMDGFQNGLALLKAQPQMEDAVFEPMIASSSAAGGLKMIAVGLVPALTANAAKLAATSAGAKVIDVFAYEMGKAEQQKIYDHNPDIVLLSGGIDGGNKKVILHNAQMLAQVDRPFSVIVAGNRSANEEIEEILTAGGKNVIIVENVMPKFNELNIMPAKTAIRNLFIERIIDAKGLTDVAELMAAEIIPTPLACFEACELLSTVGTLMACDVGGATTDIYSMHDGMSSTGAVVEKGLPEPFAKRTVEGDLGVRYSITNLAPEYGVERIAEHAKTDVATVEQWVETCKNDTSIISEEGTVEKRIDNELAACCVELAMARHCGSFETIYTMMGPMTVQTGKDLSDVEFFIGAGGSITSSPVAEEILSRAVYRPSDLNSLKPRNPRIIVDRKNILTAMGLLKRLNPEAALDIMKQEFGI